MYDVSAYSCASELHMLRSRCCLSPLESHARIVNGRLSLLHPLLNSYVHWSSSLCPNCRAQNDKLSTEELERLLREGAYAMLEVSQC
jgi:hypothetical protein